MEPTIYEGQRRWMEAGRLDSGKGGQGQVFLVREISKRRDIDKLRRELAQKSIQVLATPDESDERIEVAYGALVNEMEVILRLSQSTQGALKKLLPAGESVSPTRDISVERMVRELSVLESVEHPALVKVLDKNTDIIDSGPWFIMEYMERGNLARYLGNYHGKVLDSLTALRPIVDAVTMLHKEAIIHRDIKPDNIFVTSDGNLVLGDCGLAFRREFNQPRLTRTFENVGSRDFQADWSRYERSADVPAALDVVSLAKVLWAMVSGGAAMFPGWQFKAQRYDLRGIFGDIPGMHYLHEIFEMCITETEEQMKIREARALGVWMDLIVDALTHGCQIAQRTRHMRCRFCGIGIYERPDRTSGLSDSGDIRTYLMCNYCGHVDSFVWRKDGDIPSTFGVN